MATLVSVNLCVSMGCHRHTYRYGELQSDYETERWFVLTQLCHSAKVCLPCGSRNSSSCMIHTVLQLLFALVRVTCWYSRPTEMLIDVLHCSSGYQLLLLFGVSDCTVGNVKASLIVIFFSCSYFMVYILNWCPFHHIVALNKKRDTIFNIFKL